MNIKNELAFQIFLKKMPNERFNDMTLRAYTGAAEDSLKIAQVFIEATTEYKLLPVPGSFTFSDESDL